MMSGFRKNRPSRPFTWLLLLGAVAFAAGCSTAQSPNGGGANTNHILPSGSSVAGWLVLPSGGSHASTATLDSIANNGGSGCTQCHGSDLTGGISRVSCFGNPAGCHHVPVAGWVAPPPGAQNHGVSAKRAPGSSGFAACQICHGRNFSGGGAQVTCFNNAACHGAGVVSPHPSAPWRGPTYTHTDTNTSNAPVCAQCHFPGSPNNPADHPPTPAPAGTAPGCFNSTLCHGEGGVAHPVPFNADSHYTVTTSTFPGGCSTCHDVSAPTVKPGPACQTCHVAASPLTALNCTSCHASPPSGGAPAGAAYPNVPGAHATHIALNSVGSPISCDICHNGLGTNTLNHYNRANARPGSDAQRVPPGDAAFPATYDAQSGSSSFDNGAALSCSNVSCHGGQATPNWQTGALVVNDQCTICHVSGTTQFNSYASGEHTFHVNLFGAGAATCALCHDTAALAVDHFTTLADNSISPAVASATIGGPFITTFTAGAGTSGTCNATCHPGDRTW